MSTLAKRLKTARERIGMTQAQLAEKTGVSQQSIAKIEKGETLQPRRIEKIAAALNVPQKWLQLGIEENASLVDYTVQEAESIKLDPDVFVDIPVLNIELSAGIGGTSETIESIVDWFPLRRFDLKKAGVCAKNVRIVKIWGNSLLPVLNNGDYVAVDTSQQAPIRDGDLYAIRDGVLLRVKILINKPDGGVIIRSFNKDEYPDEILTFSEKCTRIHIIGRVFWSTRTW